MASKHSSSEYDRRRTTISGDDAARILELEAELAATRARAQESVEEWATTSEELRNANAELVEANGLLHDTSERLGIANAELHALNLGLRTRIAEADRAYADLENLLESSRVATVFVDRAGRVRRFTPAVGDILAVGAAGGAELRALLHDVMARGVAVDGHALDCDVPHLGRRRLLVNATRLALPASERTYVVLAIEDATARTA